MQEVSKSALIAILSRAADKKENFESEFAIKKTSLSVKVSLQFKERDIFIDADGVKWIRA